MVICILSIFVKRFVMKNLFLSLFFILLTITIFGQVPTPNIADGQVVCPNAVHFYGDQVVNPTSTYTFNILPPQAFTVVGQQIQVTWLTPGVYTMTMTETNAAGCQFTTIANITVPGLAPGTYNITVVSQTANGCSITGAGTATVEPLPTGIIYTD